MEYGPSVLGFVRRIALFAAALEILVMIGSAAAQVPPLIPLPGRWSVPLPIFIDPNSPPNLTKIDLHNLPFTTQNGEQWAPAPSDTNGNGFPTRLPFNLLALRLEVPGNLFDIGFAGLEFLYGVTGVDMPKGTKISDIKNLSFDSYYEHQNFDGFPPGGNCGFGSPRYTLLIDVKGDGTDLRTVHVYAGPFPGYGGDQFPPPDGLNGPKCDYNTWRHNDLINVPATEMRWDTLQFNHVFYNDQAGADAAVAAVGPNYQVLNVALIWDGIGAVDPGTGNFVPAFGFPGKTVFWSDNLRVNNFLLDEPGLGHACSLLVGLTKQGICSQLGLGPPGT
jgi:hypothetical protein